MISKILLTIIFTVFYITELIAKNWWQINFISDIEQEIKVNLILEAKNLQDNEYYCLWSFI